MNEQSIDLEPRAMNGIPASAAKVLSLALLVYVVGLGSYAILSYSATRSKLLTYGLSDATANLLGFATMLVALGLPALALLRIVFWRPKLIDYAAALLLPTLSWGIAQLPARFDSVTGKSLQYCAARPDGSVFCLDRPGVDPLTQRNLVAIDGRAAEEQFRREKDLLPRPVTAAIPQIAFFDALTGDARIWVSKNEIGCYDLFNNPGVNPQTGERLEPVTKSIVQAIRRCGVTAASTQASAPPPTRSSDLRPVGTQGPAPALRPVPLQLPAPVQSPAITQSGDPEQQRTAEARRLQLDQSRRDAESQALADRRRTELRREYEQEIAAAGLARQRREAEAKLLHQQRLADIENEYRIVVQGEWASSKPDSHRMNVAKANFDYERSQADVTHQQKLSEIAASHQRTATDIQSKLSRSLAELSPQR